MIDYLSAIMLIVGYILIGKRIIYGWIFSTIGNIGYVYILVDTEFKGLLLLSITMALLCVYNFLIWTKKLKNEKLSK